MRQIARYGGLSVLSAAISLGTPALLHEALGVDERIAVAIGLVCAFLANFFGLRSFVFGQRGGSGRSFGRFLAVSLGFRAFEYVSFLILFSVAGLPYMAALLIPLLLSICLKFITYKLFVFSPARSG